VQAAIITKERATKDEGFSVCAKNIKFQAPLALSIPILLNINTSPIRLVKAVNIPAE